jgi:molecular chaperone GrpE
MRNDKVSEIRKILNQEPPPTTVNSDTEGDPAGDPSRTGAVPELPSPDAALDELQKDYDELADELKAQKEEFLRQAAEYENSRKRLAKDRDEAVKYAGERLLQDIFPVLDSLEMTLSHVKPEQAEDPLVSGVRLILKQFQQTLTKYGLEEVGNAGDPFDPNKHEAIGTEASAESAPGLVTRVHRKGYRLKDRLVRAALVTVSQ